MIRLYHSVIFKNSVSAQSLTGGMSGLGLLAGPAWGEDVGLALINSFEHHLRCRSCCICCSGLPRAPDPSGAQLLLWQRHHPEPVPLQRDAGKESGVMLPVSVPKE